MSTVLFWFRNDLRLHDYDVYSNQGNWLYVAGRGIGALGGRPMWGML